MTFYLYDLDNCRENQLDIDSVAVVEIECPRYLVATLTSLISHTDVSPVTLYDKDKRLNVEREVCVLLDFFKENEMSKSTFSKLQDKLLQEDNFEYKVEFEGLITQIDKLLSEIVKNSEIKFNWSVESEPKDFMKLMGFALAQSQDILENCLNFVSVCATMKLYKVVVFYNLKSLLSTDSMVKLYRHCLYCGQLAIFVDSRHYEDRLPYEKKIYVDSDFFDMYL